MSKAETRLPRGMRDLLPEAARRRQAVIDQLREIFESYAYEPLETPALELSDTLFGKYGPEAERLIYRAGLSAEPDLALRYDLSVPLARVVAAHAGLPRPFRRYQIGPVWRGERPQRGRYREFVQADLDIVGASDMLADAEIITVVIRGLEKLGFAGTLTKINNRKLLNGIGRYAGVSGANLPGLYRSIDKLDKVGLDGVRLELLAVGLPGDLLNRERQAVARWLAGKADKERMRRDLAKGLGDLDATAGDEAIGAFIDALGDYSPAVDAEDSLDAARLSAVGASVGALRRALADRELIAEEAIDRLLALLQVRGASREVLAELGARLDDTEAREGIDEIGQVLDGLDAAGIAPERYVLDFATVRGLEYYTGTIFETVVVRPPIGSITGGGRYDQLVGLFGREAPAVGTSFGVDRLVDALEEMGKWPESVTRAPADVLMTRFDAATTPEAIRLAERLRRSGLRVELYLSLDPLGEQIRYALRREIPVVAVIGPDEAVAGTVTVRDLARQRQVQTPASDVVGAIRQALAEPGAAVGAGPRAE